MPCPAAYELVANDRTLPLLRLVLPLMRRTISTRRAQVERILALIAEYSPRSGLTRTRLGY